MINEPETPLPEIDSVDGMTTLTLRQSTLAKLHDIRLNMGRSTLDAALNDLVHLHNQTPFGGVERIHGLMTELDRGVSAVAVLLQEQLLIVARLEQGAIAYNIDMGNLLAESLGRISQPEGAR